MLKLWWGAPEGDLISLAWQVRPPPFLTGHSTGVNCIFTLVLPCEKFAESSDNQFHSAYSTLLRYHRALCLGRRDDRVQRISQASNIKKPTCFMGTSWIVGSDEGHDSAIRSVCLFCHRTPASATLCQHAKYKNISLSAKIGFLQRFFNDKTSFWLFGGKRLIAKLVRGNFYTFWSFHFFSNCSYEWKHVKVNLPTINQCYMLCLKSLDH